MHSPICSIKPKVKVSSSRELVNDAVFSVNELQRSLEQALSYLLLYNVLITVQKEKVIRSHHQEKASPSTSLYPQQHHPPP